MTRKISLPLLILLIICGCSVQIPQPTPIPVTPHLDRESLIPATQIKISPETDIYPLRSESTEYEDPVPLPYPINTTGAEDSAFVWFTPDVSKPAEAQVNDGVTGIYVFHKTDGGWRSAERVWLIEPGKVALDGCEFVLGEKMWFCTAREGYTGLHWFTAELKNNKWTNWEIADFKPEYQVGELHITADGNELYFHSSRPGGEGGVDIWVSRMVDGEWGEPENVTIVNSPHTDGWPFVSQDGTELWFTRAIGAPEIYRSKRIEGVWGEPEKMFSIFSGESSMDNQGNVFFTHHYYKDDVMLEADIYIARRK